MVPGIDFPQYVFNSVVVIPAVFSREYGDASSQRTAEGDLAGRVRRIWQHLRLVDFIVTHIRVSVQCCQSLNSKTRLP